MNTFFHIVPALKRFRRNSYQDPARDWLVMITLSLIAFVGIVVWDIWAFDTVVRGGTIGAQTAQAPATFDTSALDDVHTIFESRAAEEQKYVTGTYHFVDPSQ